jgi:hypothetical protein
VILFDGRYIAYGNGKIAISTDGQNWGEEQSAYISTYTYGLVNYLSGTTTFYATDGPKIAWNGQRYVALAAKQVDGWTKNWMGEFIPILVPMSCISSSENGLTWIERDVGGSYEMMSGVVWGGPAGQEKFVVVGPRGMIRTSTDGMNNWTSQQSGTTDDFLTLAWTGGQFVALTVNNIYTSLDGVVWIPYSETGNVSGLRSLAFDGRILVAVGDGGKIMVSSPALVGEVKLVIEKDGNGTGTVTSSPSKINCGSACSANFTTNSVVTLTATPDPFSTFTGWSGGGCSGTGPCVVTMDSEKNVAASFIKSAVTGKITTEVNGQTAGVGNANIFVVKLSTTTDGNGNFTLTNLPSGNYTLVVSAPNFIPLSQQVNYTGDNLQVTVPPLATYFSGDASGNGRIDLVDIIYMLQILSGQRDIKKVP